MIFIGGAHVNNRKQSSGEPKDPWKRKMGVGFSGLEHFRDFLVAFVFIVVLVGVAMVIAYIAFA